MLVLLDERHGGLTVHHAGWWDRLRVSARASRLDRALAAGASPDATVHLALRAQALVGPSVRRDLARGLARLMDRSTCRVARRLSSIPLCRDRVSDVAVDLQSLVDLLVDPGPVSARGVAQVRALLGDGAGPLYNRANTDDLRAQVRRTVEALDPLDTPSHLT